MGAGDPCNERVCWPWLVLWGLRPDLAVQKAQEPLISWQRPSLVPTRASAHGDNVVAPFFMKSSFYTANAFLLPNQGILLAQVFLRRPARAPAGPLTPPSAAALCQPLSMRLSSSARGGRGFRLMQKTGQIEFPHTRSTLGHLETRLPTPVQESGVCPLPEDGSYTVNMILPLLVGSWLLSCSPSCPMSSSPQSFVPQHRQQLGWSLLKEQGSGMQLGPPHPETFPSCRASLRTRGRLHRCC